MPVYDTPELFKQFPGLIAAQSTRLGGVSSKPFDSLNLGLSTEDDSGKVQQNRKSFFDSLGISEEEVASSGQVHGKDGFISDRSQSAQCYDAVITNKKGLLVAITIADCTPVLIYDSYSHAAAAIHAGWRGTVQQIVPNTLQQMKKEYGTRAEDCFAYIGTCISEKAFEVEADVADQFSSDLKHFDERKQKFFVDLKKANLQQLINEGVPTIQIEISDRCTVLNNDRYFSYRKEKGQTGRMMAVIGTK